MDASLVERTVYILPNDVFNSFHGEWYSEPKNTLRHFINYKRHSENHNNNILPAYHTKISNLNKTMRTRFTELQQDVHLTQSYPLYIYHSDEVYKHPVETIFHVDFYGKKASFEARLEKPERIHVKIKDNHPYGIGMGIPFTVVLELKPMKTEL